MEEILTRLVGLVEANDGEDADIATHVAALAPEHLAHAEAWATDQLAALPTSLFGGLRDPHHGRRERLQRVVAYTAARQQRGERLLDLLRGDWLRGASVMPLLVALRDDGRGREAAMTARLALLSADETEAEAIEQFLTTDGAPPDGWAEAVAAFARAPSHDGWLRLLQFTPDERWHPRVRATLRLLRRLGVDPDVVFELASTAGVTSDAIELAESGLVTPATVEACAARADPRARATWLALAASAAFANGDRFGTVRLLRAAYDASPPSPEPWVHVLRIRDDADDELNTMLDRAGIPRIEA